MINEAAARKKLTELVLADRQRLAILQAIAQLRLPEGYVAAGFLRNLAWDYCHGFLQNRGGTPLNDVDIIYFDADCRNAENSVAAAKHQEQSIAEALQQQFPALTWDIKNQARMHIRNHHSPYKSCRDAMSFWPEQETAVGVQMTLNGDVEFVSAFGLARLFNCGISHNSCRERRLFEQRVRQKNWLQTWPKLKLQYN